MTHSSGVPVRLVALFTLLSLVIPGVAAAQAGTGDLDAFMARVLTRRDDNWKRLQQYVLDENERIELRGPGEALLYGRERDFTWYIRDGVFVRSPLAADGAPVDEEERRRYEDDWLARERKRADEKNREADADAAPAPVDASTGADTATLARLVREPRFISAAYFLRFRFEPGRYAFVGPEEYEGRRVLRIEYYPEDLYHDDKNDAEAKKEQTTEDRQREERFERQMNKVALVTLWIEPDTHQIVKYTFDNIAWDFLPGRSLVRIDDISATMEMSQPFPGIWLPRAIRGRGAVTLAAGTYEVRYRTAYHDYREADVKVRIR